jgi:hypothetical protein
MGDMITGITVIVSRLTVRLPSTNILLTRLLVLRGHGCVSCLMFPYGVAVGIDWGRDSCWRR